MTNRVINVPAGQTSPVFLVSAGGRVSVTGTGTLQYTLSPLVDINNNLATWINAPTAVPGYDDAVVSLYCCVIATTSVTITISDGDTALDGQISKNGVYWQSQALTSAQAATIARTSGNGFNGRAASDQAYAQTRARAAYEDAVSGMFIEPWAGFTNWTKTAGNDCTVSGGKMYSGGTAGGNSGMNHSYAVTAGSSMRAVFVLNLTGLSGGGGVIIGVSKDAAGAAPAAFAANVRGLYFAAYGAYVQQVDNGSFSNIATNFPTSGTYIVTVGVDANFISIVARKTDGTREYSARFSTSGFAVNNLYVFNSDTAALSGPSIGMIGASKSISSITPRTGVEGNGATVIRTGDGTNGFRVSLPPNYDSRIPCPLAICFHGAGTNEAAWGDTSAESNYALISYALNQAGYIVASAAYLANLNSWGMQASLDAYYALYQHVRANYSIGPVVFVANSMGGLESILSLNESRIPGVVAWVGTSPALNLANTYANPTFTSAINTAYGISGDYATKTAGRDPMLLSPAAARGIPMMFLAADDDTTIPKANNTTAYVSLLGSSSAITNVAGITGGHGFSIASYTTSIVSFLNAQILS